MKKFISFIMVLALCMASTVFASAKTYGDASLPDIDTVWADKNAYPYALIFKPSATYQLLIHNDSNIESTNSLLSEINGNFILYEYNGSEWVIWGSPMVGSSTNVAYKDMVWSSIDIYDSDGNLHLEGPKCDGSTCPATDWNYNNVCDDCGMTFSVRRSYSWPALPSVEGAYQNYFIYESGGKYTLYIISSDTSYTVDAEASGGYLTFGTSEVASSHKYTYDGGTDWYRESSRNDVYYNNKVNAGSTSVELLVSTFNWYDEDGGLFFSETSPPSSGDWGDDSGGDGGSSAGSGWDDEDSSGLWGWLSSIVSGLETVWQAITNLPQLIANSLRSFFAEVKDAVLSLPTLILDGIKAIFIPDKDFIEVEFNSFLQEMKMKFNIDVSAFENLFQTESAVSDTYVDYNVPGVGNFHLKVFDSSFLAEGVGFFRPIIRGFLVLMILLFHVKQLIGFFGYDSGVVAGRSEHIKSAREGQKE